MPIAWTDGDTASSTRLNAASNHQMTGNEINALTSLDAVPGFRVFCTADSGDLSKKAGKRYVRTLSSTWELESLSKHFHIGDDDGGRESDILLANLSKTIDIDKRYAKAAAFWQTTTSGGTIADDPTNGRIVIQTNTTSNATAQIYDGGSRKLNFAVESGFESTLQVSSNTNFQLKAGIAAEDVGASNTTTAKYGIEGCSSSGTVFLVFSADGSVRSTVSTAAPIVTGQADVYLAEHISGTSVTVEKNGTVIATKTNNIPVSGLTGNNNLYKAGIKTLAGENKILYHYGGPRIVGGT
jgi:hypothetical protein